MGWQDLRHFHISNFSILGLGLLTLVYIYFNLNFQDQLWVFSSCFLGLGLLKYLGTCWKKENVLGMGDIWVLSLLSAILSWDQLAPFIQWTGIWGILWGVIYIFLLDRSPRGNKRFPFIPPIIIAFFQVKYLW